jgi:nucleoside-diphosphate-sugar epimerase
MKILVMGGTRFFGKRLVQLLVEQGHDITLATRGNTDAGFGEKVNYITLDRFDKTSLSQIGEQKWDVVYDQICYAPTDAAEALEILEDKVGRYIFTSSMAVYDQNYHMGMVETEFDPYNYPIQMGRAAQFTYAEGKRLAEAVFHQQTAISVVSVRFPIVFGLDDYTRRLHDPIKAIQAGETVQIQPEEHKFCLVSAAEAADFLVWLASQTIEGPYNACSNGVVGTHELVRLIEEATGVQAQTDTETPQHIFQVLNFTYDYTQNTDKTAAAGFAFANLMSWLRPLITDIAKGK